MAGGYDGEIRIKTKIENNKMNSQLMQLENRMEKTANKANKLEDEMRKLEQLKVPTDEYKKMENQFESLVEKGKKLSESLKNTSKYTPTDEYKDIQKQIDTTASKLNSVRASMEKFLETGGNTDSRTFKNMEYDASQLENTIEFAKGELLELEQTGKDKQLNKKWSDIKSEMKQTGEEAAKVKSQMRELENSGKDVIDQKSTEKYKKLSEQLRNCNKQMDILQKKHQELEAKQLEKLANAAKKTSGMFSTLLSRLKGITLSLFIFNWITKGFNAMVSAFKDGIQSMAKYSNDFNLKMSEMKSAASTLRASIGTLAAPILSALVPAIVTLCTWLTNAINAMNRFISAVSGKSTWTRAKKQQIDYAKSLDKTSSAAKKAAGALASFDELNVINTNSSGGGGSGGSGTDAGGYEEVALTEKDFAWVEDIKHKFEMILPVVAAIGTALATWKVIDFLSNLMQINPILGTIFSMASVIAGIFLTIKGLSDMWVNGVDWKGLLEYFAGIALSVGGLYVLLGPVAAGIALIVESIAGFITALKDINENGLNAQNACLLLVSALGLVAGMFLVFGAPAAIVVGAITGIIAAIVLLGQKSDAIKEKLQSLWDEHVSPFIDDIVDGVNSIKDTFMEFWDTYVKPMLDELGQKFNQIMEEHIQPMIDLFIELLGSVIDALHEFWNNVLVPLINWFIENILPVIIPIFQGLMEGAMELFGFLSDIVSGIIQVFKGIIDFLVGVFTGDWEKAWNGVSDIISGVLKIITGFIQAKFSLIRTIVQTVLNVISGVVRTILYTIRDVVKYVVNLIFNIIISFLNSINSKWAYIFTGLKDITINIFDGIWETIRRIINSILGGVEGMANGVVNGINTCVDALNSLHFDVPDWIPELGGKTFGFSIGHLSGVSIPRLANGGITTGSTLANIGEAGREAVLPLENNLSYLEPLAEMIASKMEGVQTVKIVPEESGIFKIVRESANDYYRRTGRPAFDL